MTVNNAVATRISALLKEKNISQYRLEQDSGIQHGSMQCIMNGRNKTITLSTLMMIAKGLNMTVIEFLDDKIFDLDNLEIE
ncbi:MAG: helix-turn-helix transcriptional regulator [Clostridia bacterium]|nr:helix-turn-helix transcriptional regulator [Clostridia bacterium]